MKPNSRIQIRRIVVALFLIFSVFAAWLAYVLVTSRSDHQTVRLADGTVIELLGYSFGKTHEMRQRPPIVKLQDLLTLLHPAPIIRAVETEHDALLLWVKIPHRLELHSNVFPWFLATARGPNGYSYPANMKYYEVKYTVGNRYGSSSLAGVGAAAHLVPADGDVVALPITCYPQRASRFAVDITQYGGKLPLATFQIVNPNTSRMAPFQSELLPATQQEQDLKLTLASISATHKNPYVLSDADTVWATRSGAPKDGARLAGADGRQHVSVAFTYQGKPDSNWKLSELEAFDAMGNRTQEMAPVPMWPCLNFFPPCAGEPYRLRIGVQKTWQHSFDSDELWTVKNIPLPLYGNPVKLHEEFRRDYLHLQLLSVYGMNGKDISSDMAIVQIKVETPVANPVLMVHAEDEHGQTITVPWAMRNRQVPPGCTDVFLGNVTTLHEGWNGDNDPHYRSVVLKIPKGVKRVNLSFRLPRTHYFEFNAPAYQHSTE